MTDRPTRRRFLGACSAAAAALGLTASAEPVRPPIAAGGLTPERLKEIEAATAELKPITITITYGGSGYTMPPVASFHGAPGSGATATLTPRGVAIRTR